MHFGLLLGGGMLQPPKVYHFLKRFGPLGLQVHLGEVVEAFEFVGSERHGGPPGE
jgi:hypothetical protein